MNRPPLNNTQIKILRAISESIDTRGFPPTLRELCEAAGVTSTSTIHHQLRSLEYKGYITRDYDRARAISIVSEVQGIEYDQPVVAGWMPIERLYLSGRPYRCLKGLGINTVNDLTKLTEQQLLSIWQFGASSLDEVKAKLAELGLTLAEDAA